MNEAKQGVTTVYFNSYRRKTRNQPTHHSLAFATLEEARRDASVLHSAGFQGSIMKTYEPLYDEEKHAFRDVIVVDQF